ncbi:protease Do-like 1, chloroplastic [Chenopodium quinoa]|uniref:protease Do-like 1, chloroplastic n=1 Tax=Chenopodium quinoa TaxID=63459 RepID=UPI000B798721|nr:protease Do-like 1, chloroplastic [Chenopodium quinoa]
MKQDALTSDVLEVPQGSGSGFIWDTEGHIVINYLICGASDLRVTLANRSTYEAKVVGYDQDKDALFCALKYLKRPLRFPKYCGAIVGLEIRENGLRREISSAATGRPIQDVIQTDVAINPGNSRGPILDSSGNLIGISTALYSPSGASSGVGFNPC